MTERLYYTDSYLREFTARVVERSADGLTLWSIFSVYGDGAKKGINAHDKFNLVKATLRRH